MKRAFTLIELLVVIAIIAILAAILFPVFAQAKQAAKKASDLSNAKQTDLASLIYMGDSDDVFPVYWTNSGTCLPNAPTLCGYRNMWQFAMYPYMKNWQMLGAPDDPTFPASDPVNAAFRTSYGFNYGYLGTLCLDGDTGVSASAGCSLHSPEGLNYGQWFIGLSSTAVQLPGNIVAFADGGGRSGQTSATTVGSMVNPPDAWPATKYFYGPVEVGWGTGTGGAGTYCQDYFSTAAGSPGNNKYANTDGFRTAYAGGGNLVFVDGHAKFMQVGDAAVGTNYSATLPTHCEGLLVTDYSAYHWDPRHTSGTQQ